MIDRLKQLSSRIGKWLARFPWIFPILAILLVYWRLPLTFFEQDEWKAFEIYILEAGKPIYYCFTVQRPLTCFVNTLEWHVFGLNASFYGLLSLVLISLTTLVLYRFLTNWNIPKYKAVIASSIFPLFVAGSQAFTWFGAFSASLPSFLFGLLAVDFLLRDIKKPSLALGLGSLVSALISLYFKEESLWLLPVLIAAWWTFSIEQGSPRSVKSFVRHLGLLIIAIVVFLYLEKIRQSHNALRVAGLVSTTDAVAYRFDVLRSFVLLPYHHLSHIIIAPEYMDSLRAFSGRTVASLSALISAFMVFYLALLLYVKDKKERPMVLFFVVWALVSFSSYAIFGKNPEFLEGRYYFVAQAPIAALLVIGLLPARVTNLASLNTMGVGLLAIILLANVALATKRLSKSVDIANERKNIIAFFQKRTGPLPKKAVIYTETTNFGYAGLAANILPFQNGPGTLFRVVYQGKGQDYRVLGNKQDYLWDILAQGYDEADGVGFGYFRDYGVLAKTVREKKIPTDSVYAFRYEGQTMYDVTNLVRGRLILEQKELIEIPKTGWTLTSSNDSGVDEKHGLKRVLDGDPKSDWATSHKAGQFLEVDLGKPVENVAQIILTTADGNSYPKVYQFDYSADGEKRQIDFTDVGRTVDQIYTPILFQPKTIRKARITITDPRPTFFLWSVSDLSVWVAHDKAP